MLISTACVTAPRSDRFDWLFFRRVTAGRELRSQVELQDVDELVERDAQAVVAAAREADESMAEGGIGQGVGHDRLDVLLAFRAVVPVNGVLGDDRLEVLGQVFDQPRAAALAALQRPAATRADRQAMFLPVIDLRRRRAMWTAAQAPSDTARDRAASVP